MLFVSGKWHNVRLVVSGIIASVKISHKECMNSNEEEMTGYALNVNDKL